MAFIAVIATLLTSACSSVSTESFGAASSVPVLDNEPVNAPVIALVLGGGGAKGFAHIGVIKALEANNITPDLIVGTSVGSFVGSIYASGKSASELERLALNTPDSALTDLTLSYQGVIEGKKLRQFVNNQVNHLPIESFPIQFAAVAAEKHTYKKAVFNKGEAGLIVQASSSVPNLFIAPRIPDPATSNVIGKKYIDGGVVSIVPVDTARSLGADMIIAVDLQVNTGPASQESISSALLNNLRLSMSDKTLWTLLEQGYTTYLNESKNNSSFNNNPNLHDYYQQNKDEISRADIIIRPEVSHIGPLNTSDRAKAIAAGEAAALKHLPAIIAGIEEAQIKHRGN